MANEGFRSSIPTCTLGGMRIASLSRAETARVMVDAALGRRTDIRAPLYLTSTNGQVLSAHTASQRVRSAYSQADLITTDSLAMVGLSKLVCKTPVPERCSSTALFHQVAKLAPEGVSFFLFGSTQEEVEQAVLLR